MLTHVVSLVLGVAGSIIASAIFPRLQAAASAVLVRTFGVVPFRHPALLSGTWRVIWEVESTRYKPLQIDPEVRIRQLGARVFATISTEHSRFDVTGTIDGGRYVTGTWCDRTDGGYHGSFQLVIDPATRDMAGLWIGYSTTGVVKAGRFTWVRSRGAESKGA